jgi:recombination protein RecA
VRLDIRRIGSITENSIVLGNRVRVKVVKNKARPPFREAEFDVIFNEGISQIGELLDLGSEKGIVDKAGAWYSFRGERLGQGREGSKAFLKANPEVAAEIRKLILSSYGIEASGSTEIAALVANVDKSVSSEPIRLETPEISTDASKKNLKGAKKKPEMNGLAAEA